MPTTKPDPKTQAAPAIPRLVVDNRPWTEAEAEDFDRRVREKRERRAKARACS